MLEEPLVLADVGVRWGFDERWLALPPATRLIGFDADPQECEALARRHAHVPGAVFPAVALGADDGSATLHVTEEPACSSLFEPDVDFARRRAGMKAFGVQHTEPVRTTPLAAWAERSAVTRFDVMKLDVQGAELDVLRGAGELVDPVRALDLEVAFHPVYRDQPLFSDVDRFLRAHGFLLWRIGEQTHHALPDAGRAGHADDVHIYGGWASRLRAGGGQLLWARARYVHAEVADPPRRRPWHEHLRAACAAWSLYLDDLALAGVRRAARAGAPSELAATAERLERHAARREWLRRARGIDWRGAPRRYARVATLAARGLDDDRIAGETGMAVGSVRLLRRLQPTLRRRP
jgi:FkbM family methyltransferase